MQAAQLCQIVAVAAAGEQVAAECSWQGLSPEDGNASEYYRTLDISVKRISQPGERVSGDGSSAELRFLSPNAEETIKAGTSQLGSEAAVSFFVEVLLTSLLDEPQRVVRLVLPRKTGFIIRGDLLPNRLIDCQYVSKCSSFAQPEQCFQPTKDCGPGVDGLFEAVRSSIGAVLVDSVAGADETEILEALDIHVNKRLSFPWLAPKATGRKRIALFEGRTIPEDSVMVYGAAKALNCDLVVLDRPGHWCQDEKYADIREAFLPINIMPDDGLPGRVVEALKAYGKPVHGIYTFCDFFTEAVAKASQLMGFPYNSAEGLKICSDKYRMREFQNMPCLRASKMEDLVAVDTDPRFRYPLIVKPCIGWNSEGVSKVFNREALQTALTAFNTNYHGHDVVVENYCDGPEFDANVIVENGEVMWFEVNDDFPKGADMKDSNAPLTNFLETGNVIPSALPASEIQVLHDSTKSLLARLGITFGIYHLEVRMQDSRTYYDKRDGVLDLRTDASPSSTDPTKPAPSMFLVELNPRPPGHTIMSAIYHAYGIDYGAIGMLYAMGDSERARVLLHPFGDGEAQAHYEQVAIHATRGGTFASEDAMGDFSRRFPELSKFVAEARICYRKGDVVPAPESGTLAWIAVIIVRSRNSRRELRERADEIRAKFTYEIE